MVEIEGAMKLAAMYGHLAATGPESKPAKVDMMLYLHVYAGNCTLEFAETQGE
jgi:hypothetical protein